MASPEVLDLSNLLAPFEGDNPAGVDLRQDPQGRALYHEIRDARKRARDAERYLLFKDGTDDQGERVSPPDWRPVLQLGPKALGERSKDLEVTALLLEALVRERGFAGLRDGLRLARGLVEQFWEHLYPLPDEEDGVRARVACLTSLNGEETEGLLIGPISRVPITAGRSVGPFSLADYNEAVATDRVQDPEKRAQRLAANGGLDLAVFQQAVSETSAQFFTNLLEDLDASLAELQQLASLLEERCGADAEGESLAPPTSAIRRVLDQCRGEVERFSRGVLTPDAAESSAVAIYEGDEASSPVEGNGGGGPVDHVRNREEAFRALLRVAEFFRRTEPHSPVSYALEQAVRWGRMPLPELLSELVGEPAMRQQMFRLIGIPEPRHEE